MKNFIRLTTISAILAAMLISAYDADAQATRRATTSTNRGNTTSTQSTQERRESSTATRSSSSSTSGTQANRVTATSRSNNSSASRNNASSSTQSTQERRGSASTATRSGSTSSSSSSSTSGSSAARVTGTSRSGSTSASSTSTSAATQSAQDRRTTTGTTSATRAAGTSASGGTGTTVERSTATANRGISSSVAESSTTQQQTGTSTVTRSNIRATSRAGLTSSSEVRERSTAAPSRSAGGITASGNKASSQTLQDLNYSGRGHSTLRLDDRGNLNRIPPRERDYTRYDRPGMFYGSDPHYFGYKIHTLPPSYRRIRHWGVDYYYYNNVYYRHYGSYYVVCRPPYGVVIDYDFYEVPFARVRFAYYHDVFRSFDIIDSNYRTIINQNRIIAQNNARLARQHKNLALNSSLALTSYEIASALGLIQSFAGINNDYFYEDGVFYSMNRNGRFEVIVPPAGALVDELPDDYDVIVLNGVEYYKVDDTVYRLVLITGTPCLEVLGQMYGTMARNYNYYYQ